jgi:hypothetical protein
VRWDGQAGKHALCLLDSGDRAESSGCTGIGQSQVLWNFAELAGRPDDPWIGGTHAGDFGWPAPPTPGAVGDVPMRVLSALPPSFTRLTISWLSCGRLGGAARATEPVGLRLTTYGPGAHQGPSLIAAVGQQSNVATCLAQDLEATALSEASEAASPEHSTPTQLEHTFGEGAVPHKSNSPVSYGDVYLKLAFTTLPPASHRWRELCVSLRLLQELNAIRREWNPVQPQVA